MNLVYDVATSVIPHGVMWASRCDEEGFRSYASRVHTHPLSNKPNIPSPFPTEDEIPIIHQEMDTANAVAVQSTVVGAGTRVSDDEFTTV